jgi:hypothetical protein
MKFQRPIQIGLETSLFSEKAQPLATKAWNFCVALYYKAGGAFPWKVEGLNPETCFIGISFYRHLLEDSFEMHTSLAQVFTGEGEAFVLRGHKFHLGSKTGKEPTSRRECIRESDGSCVEKIRGTKRWCPTQSRRSQDFSILRK